MFLLEIIPFFKISFNLNSVSHIQEIIEIGMIFSMSKSITGQPVLDSELRNQPNLQPAPDSKQNQKRTNEYKSYQRFHNDNEPSM